MEKGLASDIDTAIKLVLNQLKKDDDRSVLSLNIDDFNRIFLLAILKESFLEVLAKVEQQAQGKDIPLSLKIENYQRQNLLNGSSLRRNNQVDADLIMKQNLEQERLGVPTGLTQRAIVSPRGSLRQGAKIMQQHVRDRDYSLSRSLIDAV